MEFSIGITGEPSAAPRARRGAESPLKGVVPLDGLSLTIGANSTGKTVLLENVEQAIEHGWRPRSDSRLYRRQHAKRQLYLQLDMRPGTRDWDWLGSLDTGFSGADSSTLSDEADELGVDIAQAIAELSYDALVDFSRTLEAENLDDVVDELFNDPDALMARLRSTAQAGRFVLDVDADGFAELYLDPRSHFEAVAGYFFGSAFAFPSDEQRAEVLPPVVFASAESADVSALAERCIATLTERWFGIAPAGTVEDPTDLPPRHPWIVQDETNQPVLALGARATARELQTATNRLLPPFIKAEGQLRLEVLPPERWTTGRTVVAGFGQGRSFRRAETSGSGTRRWIALCLELATASLQHRGFLDDSQGTIEYSPRLRGLWSKGFQEHDLGPSKRPQPILLFDEPELHLHPLAQREAGGWLSQRLLMNDVHSIVAATHSPTLLGATTSATRVLALRREPDQTTIAEITGDILSELDALATAAGLGREAWLFVTRGVLVVEGQHDRAVLQHFFGTKLGSLRCRTLVLDGTKNSSRLLDSEFLGESGLPLFVLFDNVRLESVKDGMERDVMSDEERQVEKLLRRSDKHDLTFLPYHEPDILCALPRETVLRRFDHGTYEKLTGTDDYWTDEIATWRKQVASGQRKSFKHWIAQDRLGLSRNTDLVTELIGVLTPADLPSPALHQAVHELEVRITSQDLEML